MKSLLTCFLSPRQGLMSVWAFVLFFSLCTGQKTVAQATGASIVGAVKDAQNSEVLPGATVSVRNESTGFQTKTITNSKGEYTFYELPLGSPYSVAVSYIGMQTLKQTGYSLNFGDKLTVDIRLSSGETTLKEVVVSERGFAKEVQQAGAATSITAAQIKNLPNEGRNFTRLNNLSPLQGGDNFSFGGQRSTGTNVTIDGMNAKNQWTNGTVAEGPYAISLEAIREYKIVTNDYDVTGAAVGGSHQRRNQERHQQTTGFRFPVFQKQHAIQ